MNQSSSVEQVEHLRSVLDRYEGPLLGYAARITGNADAARDVVQETFLRLCREGAASLNGRMPQWLFAVCRNLAIDAKRKGSRMTTLTLPETTNATKGRYAVADPMRDAEVCEGSDRAIALLATLPNNQQEVIRLRLGAGLSYKEIAEVTGFSISNVGFLMHTGLRKLREQLSELHP